MVAYILFVHLVLGLQSHELGGFRKATKIVLQRLKHLSEVIKAMLRGRAQLWKQSFDRVVICPTNKNWTGDRCTICRVINVKVMVVPLDDRWRVESHLTVDVSNDLCNARVEGDNLTDLVWSDHAMNKQFRHFQLLNAE